MSVPTLGEYILNGNLSRKRLEIISRLVQEYRRLNSAEEERSDLNPFSLSYEDWVNIISGSQMFSSGGGGAKKWGFLLLNECKKLMQESNTHEVCQAVDFSSLKDEDAIVPVCVMGKPEGIADQTKRYDKFLSPLCRGAQQVWKKANPSKSFKYLCPVEIGGTNIVTPALVACTVNQSCTSNDDKVYLLDGDLQGRSVQSLGQLGPYQYKASANGTCYSFISKQLDCSEDELVKHKDCLDISRIYNDTIGHHCWVISCAVPDHVQYADQLENYLCQQLVDALPGSPIACVFGGITKYEIMNQGKEYGVSGPTICRNTISRSWFAGMRMRAYPEREFEPLQDEGAVLFGKGNLQSITSGGDVRSDIGMWTVEMDSGEDISCLFNNENVALGIIRPLAVSNSEHTKEFLPITASPNSVSLQAREDFIDEEKNIYIYRGECFSNDELTSFQNSYSEGKMPHLSVNVYSVPPAPHLTSAQSLSIVGPSQWGLAKAFPDIKGLDNLQYIPSVSSFRQPSFFVDVCEDSTK